MKKRNYWAAFGISAAAAAALITAIILIVGVIKINSVSTPLPTPITNYPPAKGYDLGAAAANLKIASPKPGDKLTSPLVISGEAAGWYFEASFPVELKDANGNSLAVGVAQAQGDWMTTDFVPFIATLVFEQPTTLAGTLILKKDNPSGLPQFDAQAAIPVIFGRSGTIPEPVYTLDSGCRPAGCSGQVCSDQDIVTTCEWRDAYACYKGATCARGSDGKCGWVMTSELRSCLETADKR